jgi:hypothetical protein
LSRVVIGFITWLKGKRRTRDREGHQSWCFNLWLEETELGIFGQRQSIYTAYELIQARCVFDRANTAAELLKANEWVNQFLPLARVLSPKNPGLKTSQTSRTPLWRSLLQVANWFAYHLQLCYMWSHMTREVVTPRMAFFHPRDTQGWIYQGWARVLNRAVDVYTNHA